MEHLPLDPRIPLRYANTFESREFTSAWNLYANGVNAGLKPSAVLAHVVDMHATKAGEDGAYAADEEFERLNRALPPAAYIAPKDAWHDAGGVQGA